MVVRELLISFGVVTDTDAVDAFDKRIDAASKHMSEAGAAADKARGMIGDLVGWFARGAVAVAGFASGLAYLGDETSVYAQNIERQSEAIGISTDAYQEIRKTFEGFGVDQRDIADLFGQISQQSFAATRGASGIEQAFIDLGVSMDSLKTSDPLELLDAIADGAAQTHDPVRRLASLSTLLGEDLTKKLAPLLQQGSEGIAKFRAEVRKTGNLISASAIADAKRYRASVSELGLTFEGIKHEIGSELIPVLTELSDNVLNYVKANRAAISSGVEDFTKRVAAGFRKVRDAVREVDLVVRGRLGGWASVLTAAAVAVGVLATSFAAFKVGGALYYGFVAIEAVIAAIAAAAGVTFGVAASVVAMLLVALVDLVAMFALVYLFWQDFFTLLNGGQSVIGSFLDEFRNASGVFGEIVRAADAAIRILVAFGTIVKDVGGFVVDVLGAGIDLVANGLRGWIMLFDYLIGTSIRNFTAALAESGIGLFANALEKIAGGFERLAGIPAPAPRTMGGIDLGETSIVGMRPPPPPGDVSTSSTTNNVGGNTYQITGADPVTVVNEIDRREGARRRAAEAAFAGADI